MTLRDVEIGKSAVVTAVGGEGALRQHFLDMGLIPGTRVEILRSAPLGDPIAVRLRSYNLALRKEDAAKIQVSVAG